MFTIWFLKGYHSYSHFFERLVWVLKPLLKIDFLPHCFFFPARSIWLKQKKKLSCLSLKEVIFSANQLWSARYSSNVDHLFQRLLVKRLIRITRVFDTIVVFPRILVLTLDKIFLWNVFLAKLLLLSRNFTEYPLNFDKINF